MELGDTVTVQPIAAGTHEYFGGSAHISIPIHPPIRMAHSHGYTLLVGNRLGVYAPDGDGGHTLVNEYRRMSDGYRIVVDAKDAPDEIPSTRPAILP